MTIHRSMSFSTLLDANGIKTSIATVAAITTYTTTALNGAYVTANVATPAPNGHTDVDQYPVATASSSAGSYVNASTIRFVGTYNGEAVTRTATVVGTDGNAEFIADGPMRTVTSIIVAAQANTSGAWEFGFTDLAMPYVAGNKTPFSFLRATGAGNIRVKHVGGYLETLAMAAAEQAEPLSLERIYQTLTTVSGFRVAY
jgi:hypothetical protein